MGLILFEYWVLQFYKYCILVRVQIPGTRDGTDCAFYRFNPRHAINLQDITPLEFNLVSVAFGKV